MLVTQGVSVDLAERLCSNGMKDIDDVWSVLKKAEYSTDIKVVKDGRCSWTCLGSNSLYAFCIDF